MTFDDERLRYFHWSRAHGVSLTDYVKSCKQYQLVEISRSNMKCYRLTSMVKRRCQFAALEGTVDFHLGRAALVGRKLSSSPSSRSTALRSASSSFSRILTFFFSGVFSSDVAVLYRFRILVPAEGPD